ncbi:DUF438 domain-containing protein [Clostridium perfringens]|uniref:DUF438 domain-containing protein n=1 Tax=Clostridium perfringens TaxID=1502 RepID=UPI002904BA14|nr:DUF438 domain-containing protein [Clostridium perfringens]
MENKEVILKNGQAKVIDYERIKRLTDFLRRINKEGITKELREEGLDIVKSIDPLELSIAEQSLIDDGMEPSELRHLCDIHMEILKDELEKLKSNISRGHVLDTLVEEHTKILGLLEELEVVTSKIVKMDKYNKEKVEFSKALGIVQGILDAELHHKREEDVLFPELEKREITGPTRIMRLEHDQLREKKRRLKELIKVVEYLDFEDFKDNLQSLSKEICFELKDHIFKENYILYPTALEAIKDEKLWKSMREKCDDIGYCPFTPKECIEK